MNTFEYMGRRYPFYLKEGNACSFCLPFASQFCHGSGLDVGGYNSWVFPGATAVNTTLQNGFDAMHLPEGEYDYIFSSHTLEHVPDYVGALEHWKERLKTGGVLFLYLPHPDMEYWRPENNRKHLHLFYPDDLAKVLTKLGYRQVLASERDLYWSFCVVAFK